jgi:Effector protein
MLTPNGLLPAGGKDGRLYVLDRDHLGKKPPRRAIPFRGGMDFPIGNGSLPAIPAKMGQQRFGNPGAKPAISANGTRNGIVWLIRRRQGVAGVSWVLPTSPAHDRIPRFSDPTIMAFHRFGATCVEVSDPTNVSWDETAVVAGSPAPVGEYVPYVMGHLAMLLGTTVGTPFFQDLTNLGKRIIIYYGGSNVNNCRGPGGTANKLLRKHEANADSAAMGQELTRAMQQAQAANPAQNEDWLCEQLLTTPHHRWDPATTAGNSPLNPMGIMPANPQFAGLKRNLKGILNEWKQGKADFRSAWDAADLILLVLREYLQDADGGGSRVNYDPLKLGAGSNVRPPQIGLFHELVHAYYNAKGAQLSWEDSANERKGRYYELMAVGLQPFTADPYSENKMRACFPGTAARAKYE